MKKNCYFKLLEATMREILRERFETPFPYFGGIEQKEMENQLLELPRETLRIVPIIF